MEWKEYKLGEVCSYVVDRIDNSTLNKNNYISTENMTPNCGGVTSASNVPDGKSIWFKEGDILFSNIRPYFKKLWKADISGGCSADVLCIRANEKINPTYLYYLLIQDTFISYVMKGTKGCKMPRGDKKYNMAWVIDLPSLEVQKRIAAQLSEIDDKIAVNKKICENLEAQAQALFKHWFIDFAPFKNGKFVESELGMVPEGWRVGRAEDFYSINIGKTPPRAERQWFSESSKKNKIWISISDMGGCGAFISDSKEYLTPEAQSKFNVVMVPVGTVLLSFKLTLGRVAIADAELTTNEAIARFILPSSDYREYTYLYLKQFKYGSLGSTSSIATAVNSKIIKAMPFLMPSKEIIKDFSNIVGQLFDEIKNLNQESSRLSSLRDTLLPKLMSGEIKV